METMSFYGEPSSGLIADSILSRSIICGVIVSISCDKHIEQRCMRMTMVIREKIKVPSDFVVVRTLVMFLEELNTASTLAFPTQPSV
jgi:hypothetical protein